MTRLLALTLILLVFLFVCLLSILQENYYIDNTSERKLKLDTVTVVFSSHLLSTESTYQEFTPINRNVSEDCSCLFNSNETGHNMFCTPKKDLTTDEDVLTIAKAGCQKLLYNYSFYTQTDYTKEIEFENPIAFSLVVHKNVHQVLMLLSAIYSFQNVYCVHVDLKSPDAFMETLRILQGCLPNLLLPSKRENVIYESISRLQADINCMKDLVNIPTSLYNWKYLINLCGQDFPIRTNLEIVEQLIELKGRNLIGGVAYPPRKDIRRTKFVHKFKRLTLKNGRIFEKVIQTHKLKSPSPYNITIRKNSAYNIFSRSFLQWVLFESDKAQALLEWSNDTRTPDEHYWLMLDALDEAPGRTGRINAFQLSRFVVWNRNLCKGYWNHFSCVFGTNALRSIISADELFANKFDSDFDVRPLQCMRRLLDERKQGINNKLNPSKIPIKLDY